MASLKVTLVEEREGGGEIASLVVRNRSLPSPSFVYLFIYLFVFLLYCLSPFSQQFRGIGELYTLRDISCPFSAVERQVNGSCATFAPTFSSLWKRKARERERGENDPLEPVSRTRCTTRSKFVTFLSPHRKQQGCALILPV